MPQHHFVVYSSWYTTPSSNTSLPDNIMHPRLLSTQINHHHLDHVIVNSSILFHHQDRYSALTSHGQSGSNRCHIISHSKKVIFISIINFQTLTRLDPNEGTLPCRLFWPHELASQHDSRESAVVATRAEAHRKHKGGRRRRGDCSHLHLPNSCHNSMKLKIIRKLFDSIYTCVCVSVCEWVSVSVYLAWWLLVAIMM